MKHILFLGFLLIISSIMFFYSGFTLFPKDKYLTKKVLELSAPLNVTIDTDFLKSLDSAHE